MRGAGFLVILFAAAPAAAAPDATPPETAETRAEFEAICRRFTAGNDPFFGTAVVGELAARLAAAGATPAAAQLAVRLASEEIRLGRQIEAIAHLEAALPLLEPGTPAGGPGQAADPRAALKVRALRLLAIAHLQLAEDLNCVADHGAASCILPVAPEAVHRRPEHAREAGDLLQQLLAASPGEPRARWLLNVARMVSGDWPLGVPPADRLASGALHSQAPFPRWRDLAPQLGVAAFDLSGGAVMDDFDGDGLLDLVSSSWDPCEPLKAYRNDGRGGFEDVAAAWGLTSQLGGLYLVQADYDGDGWLDLLVQRGAWLGESGRIRKSLLRNELGGPRRRFVDVTAAAGLAYPAYPGQAAAWADFDGDGDLDLYVGNEGRGDATDPLALDPLATGAYPSQLFRNNADGTFTDVARAAGVDNRRFAKGAAWGDYDEDGDPDLYVSNLGVNRLYRNDGPAGFADVAALAGVEEPRTGSFSAWFFDYDNDGDLDLFVGAFNAPPEAVAASLLGQPVTGGNSILYRNDGRPAGGGEVRFTDVSHAVGLDRPQLVMGSNFGDLDNDGWLDLLLGTGLSAFDALMPNLAYRNDRGRRFEDVTFAGGFGQLQKGHAVAFGDLDNDGQQEIFQQLGGAFPYDAYFNALLVGPPGSNHWLVLRLEGRRANRWGVGARLEVRFIEGGETRAVHLLAGSGSSFGGSSLQQEIGLGQAERIERLGIRWPGSGTEQLFHAVERDRFYRAVEGEPELAPLDLPRLVLGGAGGGDPPPPPPQP